MRKISSLLFLILIVFGLISCSPKDSSEPEQSKTSAPELPATTAEASQTATATVESTTLPDTGIVLYNYILLRADGSSEEGYSHSDIAYINEEYTIASSLVEGYNYCGYKINDVVQIKDSIIAASENIIYLYYVESGYSAVFICKNDGIIIDIQINKAARIDTSKITIVNSEAGSRYNNSFELKYQTGKGAVFYNQYSVSDESAFLVVYNGSITGSPVLGERIVINTKLEGFTCWKLNGKPFSLSKSTTITFYGNMILSASTDSDITNAPFISISEINNKYIARCETNNQTLLSAGIIVDGVKTPMTINQTKNFEVPSLDTECYMIIKNDTSSAIIYSNNNKDEYLGRSYIVAPDGSSSSSGDYNNPLSLYGAINKLEGSDTIYVLPGTYEISFTIKLTKSGTKDNYTRIIGIGNVIFDYGIVYDESLLCTDICDKSSYVGMTISADYTHIDNITFAHAGASGVRISGNNNIVSNCILQENGNTGLHISGASDKSIESWPSNNYILNCTSFGNNDWTDTEDPGQDADGFACKITSGYNNVFDGCIAYCNSDDGWDLYCYQTEGPIGPVTIINCIAFRNGYSLTGEVLKNGNGYKLGGMAVPVNHYVRNCLAFDNLKNGFDDNSNPGTLHIYDCTAFNNNRNYQTGRWEQDSIYTFGNGERGSFPVSKSHNDLKNCISYYTQNFKADTMVGTISNSILYLSSKYILYTNYSGNIKDSQNNTFSLVNPFEATAIDLSNLYVIDSLMRDSEGYISLGDFMKLKEEYGQYGCNLSNGKETYVKSF